MDQSERQKRRCEGIGRYFDRLGRFTCAHCGKEAQARSAKQRFCSANCRNMAYYRRKVGRRVWGEVEYQAYLKQQKEKGL